MLKTLLEKDLVRFYDEASDWQEAVQLSCSALLEHKIIDQSYVDSIIACLNQYGPYIVIAPGIAMPHASQGGTGVFETAISMTKIKKPVSFDATDPSKDATLLFTLAAVDADRHLENMQRLMDLLMNDEIVTKLQAANNIDDVVAISQQYNK